MSDTTPAHEREDHGMTVGRVAAFSDGIFAIAMTLLVLSIDVPRGLRTSAQIGHALRSEIPAVLTYALSFAVIGRYWIGHHRFLREVTRVTDGFLGLNLLLLGLIALIPFPTNVLGEYGSDPYSVSLYAATIGCTGAAFALLQAYVLKKQLVTKAGRLNLQRALLRVVAIPAAFFLSIPIALFVSPTVAMYAWLAMIPLSFAAERWSAARMPQEATP